MTAWAMSGRVASRHGGGELAEEGVEQDGEGGGGDDEDADADEGRPGASASSEKLHRRLVLVEVEAAEDMVLGRC